MPRPSPTSFLKPFLLALIGSLILLGSPAASRAAGACACAGGSAKTISGSTDCYENIHNPISCNLILNDTKALKERMQKNGLWGVPDNPRYKYCVYAPDAARCSRTGEFANGSLRWTITETAQYDTTAVTCGAEKESCFVIEQTCAIDSNCLKYGGGDQVGPSTCHYGYCFLSETRLERYETEPTLYGVRADLRIQKPSFEIRIPGLLFSDVKSILDAEGNLHLPFIGEFLTVVYRLAMGVASIVAVVMLIINGIRIVVSGGGEGKTAAYKRIGQIVIGLIILWGSYSLLYIINPNLVTFKALKVKYIQPTAFEYSGDTESPLQATTQDAKALGFTCPGSGGSGQIPDIITSMKRKIAYRYGGKGKKGPPFDFDEVKPEYLKYDKFCPLNNACLDCSGFINYVFLCAGIPTIAGGTKQIFTGAEIIEIIDWKNNLVNGKALNAGDLLGWIAGDKGKEIGHVVMYIGNGQVGEARGGDRGRQGGANPKTASFLSYSSYPFTKIRRIPVGAAGASLGCCQFSNRSPQPNIAESECKKDPTAASWTPGSC